MTNPDNVGGLLPCPFCGCAMQISSSRDWHRVVGDHDGDCLLFDADGTIYPATDEGKAEALATWNRRELCRAAPAGGDAVKECENCMGHGVELEREKPCNYCNGTGTERKDSAPAGSGEVSDAIQFLRDCAANSGGVHITSERCRRAREILSLLSGEEPIRELLESCWLAIDSIQGGGAAKVELLRRIDVALLRKLQQGADGRKAGFMCIDTDRIALVDRHDWPPTHGFRNVWVIPASQGQEGGK